MSGGLAPRAVVVTRPTEYEELLGRHSTRAMAAFFLASRGRAIEEVERAHAAVRKAVDTVLSSIPLPWRRTLVDRGDLDRFLFDPLDVVITVGQDGLIANVAKYLQGQIVLGINPSAELFDGVLARYQPEQAGELMRLAAGPGAPVEGRTMVEATTPEGQRLVALNEIFVGHRSHQSARYLVRFGQKSERHSSSGIVVSTGTGATGWALSIHQTRPGAPLPAPTATELVFFVREAFPSVRTGASLVEGTLGRGAGLSVVSEMNEGGVAFGDGIESDFLDFPFGQALEVRAATSQLRLLAA